MNNDRNSAICYMEHCGRPSEISGVYNWKPSHEYGKRLYWCMDCWTEWSGIDDATLASLSIDIRSEVFTVEDFWKELSN